jgi:hypothetical protein
VTVTQKTPPRDKFAYPTLKVKWMNVCGFPFVVCYILAKGALRRCKHWGYHGILANLRRPKFARAEKDQKCCGVNLGAYILLVGLVHFQGVTWKDDEKNWMPENASIDTLTHFCNYIQFYKHRLLRMRQRAVATAPERIESYACALAFNGFYVFLAVANAPLDVFSFKNAHWLKSNCKRKN